MSLVFCENSWRYRRAWKDTCHWQCWWFFDITMGDSRACSLFDKTLCMILFSVFWIKFRKSIHRVLFLGKGFWKFGHHYLKGSTDLGHFRTWSKEGVKKWPKIRTSFMDGPYEMRMSWIKAWFTLQISKNLQNKKDFFE